MGCDIKEFLSRLPVILLVITFGTGSWVAINGMWVELPLFVALGIPEGYNLASYLVIIIQLANIGPLTFTLANWWAPKGLKIESYVICILFIIGITSCALLVFFWDVQTTWAIDNSLHSTALLCLAFFLSIVDCTSSVAFTPFMARFKSLYLTWYFVGEGFSALLPSLVALAQGVGSDECVANYTYTDTVIVDNHTYTVNCTDWVQQPKAANFPPEDFFWFLFCMMSCSAIAFVLLNVLPLAKREYVTVGSTLTRQNTSTTSTLQSTSTTSSTESHSMLQRSQDATGDHGTIIKDVDVEIKPDKISTEQQLQIPGGLLTRTQYAYLFCVLGYTNALSNGVLASIQSYSAGAYGLNTYLLASALSSIANPVACFLVIAAPSVKLSVVGLTALLGSSTGAYCLAMAILSPTPPLQFETLGSVFIVSELNLQQFHSHKAGSEIPFPFFQE